MRRGLFFKLAVINIKNHRETYFPYILSNIGCIAFLYIMLFLLASPDTLNIRGGNTVRSLLAVGFVVMAVFSMIFLLYGNSFVMKRRQKEFGLYNILGMEKIHISRMLLTETVITGAASLAGGIFVGIAASKLALLLLLKFDTESGEGSSEPSGGTSHGEPHRRERTKKQMAYGSGRRRLPGSGILSGCDDRLHFFRSWDFPDRRAAGYGRHLSYFYRRKYRYIETDAEK